MPSLLDARVRLAFFGGRNLTGVGSKCEGGRNREPGATPLGQQSHF
jgi:hypothetical protein